MATLNTRISDLEEEIRGLQEEIKGYVSKLNAASEREQLVFFADLIKISRETLNRLLDEKKAQSRGK